MIDKTLPLDTVAAALGWTVGLLLVLVDLFGGPRVGQLGILSAGAGAVLSVRRLLAAMVDREMAAFELGRRVERGPRRLH